MSDAIQEVPVPNGHDDQPEKTLYVQICEALKTEQLETENIDEFKIRAVKAFSDMDQWPDDAYEELSRGVEDWIFEATTTHKGNANKKRKKALPVLDGLDPPPSEEDKTRTRGRVSLTDEPAKRGRSRASGDDCLTRTMKLLVTHADPKGAKATDLVDLLETKYGKKYSSAAVRYAQQAFLTARTLMQPAA